MDYAIIRDGEKIIISEEELDNLLILRKFNNFKEKFPSDEIITLYLYLLTNTNEIDEDVLSDTLAILGQEERKKEEKNKKETDKNKNAFDNIDFDALKEDDEEEGE